MNTRKHEKRGRKTRKYGGNPFARFFTEKKTKVVPTKEQVQLFKDHRPNIYWSLKKRGAYKRGKLSNKDDIYRIDLNKNELEVYNEALENARKKQKNYDEKKEKKLNEIITIRLNRREFDTLSRYGLLGDLKFKERTNNGIHPYYTTTLSRRQYNHICDRLYYKRVDCSNIFTIVS